MNVQANPPRNNRRENSAALLITRELTVAKTDVLAEAGPTVEGWDQPLAAGYNRHSEAMKRVRFKLFPI
jgi:hypothetical protein